MALLACHPPERAPVARLPPVVVAPTAPIDPVVSFELPPGFAEAWSAGFFAPGAKEATVLVGCVDAREVPLDDYILEAHSTAWSVGTSVGRRKSDVGRDGIATVIAAVPINERELLTVYVHDTGARSIADVLLRTVARPGERPELATPVGWTRRRARCDGTNETLVDLDVPDTLLSQNTFHVTRMTPADGHREVDMEVSLTRPNEEQRPRGDLRYEQPCVVRKRFDLEVAGKSAQLVECDRPTYGFQVLVASASIDGGRNFEVRAQSDVLSIEELAIVVRAWVGTMVFR